MWEEDVPFKRGAESKEMGVQEEHLGCHAEEIWGPESGWDGMRAVSWVKLSLSQEHEHPYSHIYTCIHI